MANRRINRFIFALFAAVLLVAAPVSPVLAEEPVPVLTPTFTFVALPLPTPTYGTGELAIQRTSAPDATGYRFTATIMGNGVFIGTNNSRTSTLITDPLHGGASTQYVICVPETVMINVADSTGTVVASLPAGANPAGSKDLRSCPESPPDPVDTDKDGVNDEVDQCKDEAGPATNGGCPIRDADGDGVFDDIDNCKNEAGPASNNGCPIVIPDPVDSDKDGVMDDKDLCPGTPAGTLVDGNGCAVVVLPPDADGDNVPDDGTDKCVDVAGPASNGGCPVVDVCHDMDGHQPPGTDCKPETPVTCPPGMGWKDANGNGKIDEGECVKRTSPGAGPPAAVNPPAVPTPVVAPHEPVSPVVAAPAVDESPVDVVVPDQSAATSEVDATNGRGVTAETAAVGTSAAESAAAGSEGRLGFGLAGLAILLAVVAVWRLRPSVPK